MSTRIHESKITNNTTAAGTAIEMKVSTVYEMSKAVGQQLSEKYKSKLLHVKRQNRKVKYL
jgi:uncharacterized protein YqgV (UPF0045/DUF77 family)